MKIVQYLSIFEFKSIHSKYIKIKGHFVVVLGSLWQVCRMLYFPNIGIGLVLAGAAD